jgi:predicted hydrocarbon binding protein
MTALHERLRFDTAQGQVLDETRRYVLLRADVLMGLFDELPAAARDAALRAFGRSVASRGADSVRAYAATVGPEGLPALMEGAAASLGWGRWTFEGAAAGAPTDSLRLAVDNSPFAAASMGADGPVCHAIAGMLEGLAGALWQQPAQATETRCRAEHGGGRCEFVAIRRPAVPPDPPPYLSPGS